MERGCTVKISDGVFAAAWTLRYVLESSPAFISGPEQIMVIVQEEASGNWMSEQIQDPNLDEHFENVTAIEQYISDYRKQFGD